MPPDGDQLRWTIAQAVLKRVPCHMKQLYETHGMDRIEFDESYIQNRRIFGYKKVRSRSDVFTSCRIIDGDTFKNLKIELIDDFLEGKMDIHFREIDSTMKESLEKLLIHPTLNKISFEVLNNLMLNEQHTIFILSGLLRFEVLKLILTKRWRVNYGFNENGHRKMAVPFKAKDVAAEMTEFGHPDVAICFTQLSYYYSGEFLQKRFTFVWFDLNIFNCRYL